ncbi:MAG: CPBP family intramembrane metalloprotease [Clostridia bacterium]|nr:CPBP family intramembrane metalloprotease [Clostridia bacterium]
MLYHIDLTKMIHGAIESFQKSSRKLPLSLDLLIFLLVSTIATAPQSILQGFILSAIIIFDPYFIELFSSGAADSSTAAQATSYLLESIPTWAYALLLFASGFMIIASILYCKLFEKRKPYTLGFTSKDCVSEYVMGIFIGLIMISIPVLVCKLTGCVTFAVSETSSPIMITIFFVAFLFQGMGEEALFRGYLMTSLARKTNIWSAIILNSLMFALFHVGNASFSFIAFLNLCLFGIFSSVFMLKRGSIWAVGAIHSIWNFAQGNVFGFNVSGNPKFDTLLESTQAGFGKILHGGDFGPEGGLGVTAVLLAAIAIALLLPTKASEKIGTPQSAQPE